MTSEDKNNYYYKRQDMLLLEQTIKSQNRNCNSVAEVSSHRIGYDALNRKQKYLFVYSIHMSLRETTIEVFAANCPLCKYITEDIEIGKCEGCTQIVYDINNMTKQINIKMRDYGVKAVPTTIID